jgi:hypothetical protein
MGKKKPAAKKPEAAEYRFLDDVRQKVPHLLEQAASLLPFDDVITEHWCDADEDCIGIGFDLDGRVCPSGVYSLYGARIHADRVIMFTDMYTPEDECVREQYESDMPRLWAFLRQLPRPMHSFGVWTAALNGGE